jgi:hypothetical protein
VGAKNRAVDEAMRVAVLGAGAVRVVVRKRMGVLEMVGQDASSIRSE